MSAYVNFLQKLPAVQKPAHKLGFAQKFKWTAIILLLFFGLSEVPLYGLAEETSNFLAGLEVLLASKFGKLLSLGIGPIVTGSIILQMLVGSKIINWDTKSPEGRAKFQGTQKLLALGFAVVEAFAFVFMGSLPPAGGSTSLALALVAQLTIGGIIIIFLDDVVSKWGFGSGVSLFIVAGVAQQILVRIFNPITLPGSAGPEGIVPGFVSSLFAGVPNAFLLIPLFTTILVFLIALYVQGIKVEIPLAIGNISGFGRRWPLNFLYTSNMPVILLAALILNIQLLAGVVGNPVEGSPNTTCGLLGCITEGQPTSGFIYYITAPYGLLGNMFLGTATSAEYLRALSFTIFMMAGATMFAYFWVTTSGMDAKSVAEQISSIGMHMPGFRRDPRIIEQVLNKYIMPLTILGGLAIGLIAAIADMIGAIGGGTSILLAVMIIYNLYEQVVSQHYEDMFPAMKRAVG